MKKEILNKIMTFIQDCAIANDVDWDTRSISITAQKLLKEIENA